MNEEYADIQKHSPASQRAGVMVGEQPPVDRRWMTHRLEEAQALEKLGAVCKAIVRWPTGDLVYVFDREDAIAHKGYEVRKAIQIDDAQRNGPLASLVDWARSGS